MTLTQMKALYKKAKIEYYNKAPSLSDAQFDKLEDRIKELDPDWSELHKTGVAVKSKKTEVELSHYMPSLSKAYPEAIGAWLKQNPDQAYIVMDKLDGSSLQVTYSKGRPVKVVTRGNGTLGGDISFLIPHLNLKTIKDERKIVLRCEALMTRAAFAKNWASEFENSRNAVNGILNRRTPHPALKDVRIVTLGLFDMNLLAGLIFAKTQGLDVVPYVIPKAVMMDDLERVLMKRRADSEFDIDGLVVAPTSFSMKYTSADKPKGITAFKVNSESDEVEAVVKKVIWQVSGRGRITPKIRIAPTKMDGVTVQNCAAHNPKWMMDRGVGPGAKVKLVRSGGVIPKIVGVTKSAPFVGPDVPHKLAGRFFVVKNASAGTQKLITVRRIHKFMVTLGIELLAAKTIARLYDVGLCKVSQYIAYWNKPKSLLCYMYEAGLGEKQAANIIKELDRVLSRPVKLSALMVASQIFGIGIGERKLKQIEDHGISMDGLSLLNAEELKSQLLAVGGFADKTIQIMVDGFDDWKKFYKFSSKYLVLDGKLVHKAKPKIVKGGRLVGEKVSFTTYRDKAEEAWVEAQGAEIVSYGAKTTILLYRDNGKVSSKVEKARSKGIKVTTFDQLKGK